MHPVGHVPEAIGALHREAEAAELSQYPRGRGPGLAGGLGENPQAPITAQKRSDSSGEVVGGRRLELQGRKRRDLELLLCRQSSARAR